MSQRQIRLPIAVYVRHPSAFGLNGVGNQMPLPHRTFFFGILIPPQAVTLPAHRHQVHRAIVIHVHCPFAAIGNKFARNLYRTVLMSLPLPASRAWILIPIGAADDVFLCPSSASCSTQCDSTAFSDHSTITQRAASSSVVIFLRHVSPGSKVASQNTLHPCASKASTNRPIRGRSWLA